MQQIGQNDLRDYLYGWTNMMITIWQERQIMLNVRDTGELYDSFTQSLIMQSGGDQAKISFGFKMYGFYVNAGVGREVSVGNSGDLLDVSHFNVKRKVWELARKPKPWFDKGWYKSIYVIRRDVGKLYGDKAAKGIVFFLNNTQS